VSGSGKGESPEIPADFLWAQEMLNRYAPVQQAYRRWFLKFCDCTRNTQVTTNSSTIEQSGRLAR